MNRTKPSKQKTIDIMETKVTLTSAQLTEAANVSKEIEALQTRLAGILGGTVDVTGVTGTNTGGKRKMSPAARRKISEAAKVRWAKYHAEQDAKAAKAAGATPKATPVTEAAPVAVAA